jgi:hypothetical protein
MRERERVRSGTLRLNRENVEEHPSQFAASVVQLWPRAEGLGGNPSFSNTILYLLLLLPPHAQHKNAANSWKNIYSNVKFANSTSL